MTTRIAVIAAVACIAAAAPFPARAAAPIALVVDAREAPRNILHVRETIPVVPGAVTLQYPMWIPGEHGPTGPIQSVAALRITAGGHALPWQRDLVDLYSFHVDVPQGVTSIDASFDQLMVSSDPMATPALLIVNWNRVLLYPATPSPMTERFAPSIVLPAGWQYGTALSGATRQADTVTFGAVDLSTLVDSPLDAGLYERRIVLSDMGGHTNEIDAFADDPGSLSLDDVGVQHYKDLIPEADALYGARHWERYHFLLTLSDVIPGQGIEHHESSDNRASADYWTNPDSLENGADLLPHEYSHSWNGKYRRPADLITNDYQAPEKTDLLWVYEGLNQYLGCMLAFRSGLLEPSQYPEYLAHVYAQLDAEPGRLADPLVDTAVAAPYLYLAPEDWRSQRRTSDDFYDEGHLIWLSADAIIRARSHGSKSLDDFVKAFAGPPSTAPAVVPYTREQVEQTLNGVLPYDWHAFFQTWVYDVAPHPAPLGIELTGWKLVWSETPNRWDELSADIDRKHDFVYSLGFETDDAGDIADVWAGSPAARAGIGTTSQLVAVNGRKYTPQVLRDALAAARSGDQPIALLVLDADRYRTVDVDYHGGERYPHLERVPGSVDLLAQIMAPHRR